MRTEKENLECYRSRVRDLGEGFEIKESLIEAIDAFINHYISKMELAKNVEN